MPCFVAAGVHVCASGAQETVDSLYLGMISLSRVERPLISPEA